MSWAVIINMLIELFGPILVEWLKKWLDDRLKTAAAHLPDPHTFASPMAGTTALFDKAIASLPLLAFSRRTLLRRLRSASVARSEMIFSGTHPMALSAEEQAEISDAAGAARNE